MSSSIWPNPDKTGQKRRPICLSVSFTWHGTLATSLPAEHDNIYETPLVKQMI